MHWPVALLTLVLVACERQPNKPRQHEANIKRDAGADAAGDARVIDSDLLARLDALEPRDRPPPPIIRKHRRGDCRPEYAPRPNRDPNPMCRVRGGTFVMGGGKRVVDATTSWTSPTVPTTVDDFDIDQFEVTNAQAVLFLNAHGNECPGIDVMNHPSQVAPCVWIFERANGESLGIRERNGRYVVDPGRELHASLFTWEGAMRYCAWVGKQVATSAQWEYAARHDPATGQDLAYPWGNDWRPKSASCLIVGCTPSPTGGDGIAVGLFDGTGGRGDGSSPWGVHDMAGGAMELVFECDDPNTTCMPGNPCACRKLITSNYGATNPTEFHAAYRIDKTDLNSGANAVRCVRPRPHQGR